MNDRVLVTGGAGYLGSVLVRVLAERGYRVRILDSLVFGHESVERLLDDDRVELVTADIREDRRLVEILDDVNVVVHLAALSDDRSCNADPDLTTAVNEHAATRLAARCRDAGIERFLLASSCGVYGASKAEQLDESTEPFPVGNYARSKHRLENAVLALGCDDFGPTVLRFATQYGVSPRMRFDLAINTMTRDAVTQGRVRIDHHGRQWRPFVHVRDAALACVLALEADLEVVGGEIYNVGSDAQNHRIVEIAEMIARVLPGTQIEALNGSNGSPASYNVCFAKLRNELGFEPQFTPELGIDEVSEALRAGSYGDVTSSRYYTAQQHAARAEIPACEGGVPVLAEFLPFALPLIGREEEQEVIDTLRSGWLTAGPRTQRFEEHFAEFVGAEYTVATNSCTAALHMAVIAAGIGPGDEVITTPITWPATASVLLHVGATPVFADVDPGTLNIDPEAVAQLVTSRTRAIMPVHLAGNPCEMERLRGIAADASLAVIEDAAHAVGASYQGAAIGSVGTACFSFYPIKNMTAIEGGLLATDDAQIAAHVRRLSMHGVTRDAWSRKSEPDSIHWQFVEPGFKYNMNDVQAAVGLCQLRRLPDLLERRRQLSCRYREALEDLPELSLLEQTADASSSNHLFVILLRLERLRIDRDNFVLALRAEKIGAGIHFRSLHIQPYYRDTVGMLPDALPIAADVSSRILSLPLFPAMSDWQHEAVITAVRKLINFYRR